MTLEAVWYKNGKEIYSVSPVMNILCYENMKSIEEIEIYDGFTWHTSDFFDEDADDFEIRIKKVGN